MQQSQPGRPEGLETIGLRTIVEKSTVTRWGICLQVPRQSGMGEAQRDITGLLEIYRWQWSWRGGWQASLEGAWWSLRGFTYVIAP